MGNEFDQKIDVQPILDKIDNKANDISSQINNLVAEIYKRVNGFYELSDDILTELKIKKTYSAEGTEEVASIFLPGRGHFYLKVNILCSNSDDKAVIGYTRPGHDYETKQFNYTTETTIAIDLAIDQVGVMPVRFGMIKVSDSGTVTISDLRLCGRLKTVE